jgi:hypothetical protein
MSTKKKKTFHSIFKKNHFRKKRGRIQWEQDITRPEPTAEHQVKRPSELSYPSLNQSYTVLDKGEQLEWMKALAKPHENTDSNFAVKRKKWLISIRKFRESFLKEMEFKITLIGPGTGGSYL